MRNPVMRALREAVRAEISHAFEVTGHARPRDVARVVCALHPDDVLSIGTRLAEDALTEIARRELKKNTQGRDLVSQMQLPGVPETLTAQLPPAISIPLDAEVEVEVEDGEGVIYKPLAQATLADVNAHLQLLATQISADTRRHRALKELRDLALAAGATDHSPLLSAFGTAESLMTEVA
jgi:hypothetical protein